MKFRPQISENKQIEVENTQQSNPISAGGKPQPLFTPAQSNHRKTANRLYGGYNDSQRFYSYQNSVDALDVFYSFSQVAKHKHNVDEVFGCLHNIALSKLGLNFTAFGLVNNKSNCIDIKLLDRIGNIYSSRTLLSETQNPMIESFTSMRNVNISSTEFLNIPYLNQTKGIIIPLVLQDQSVGVLIAGSDSLNQQSTHILEVLSDYMTLYVVNKELSEKISMQSDVDALTGLKNHRGFQEALREELIKAETEVNPLSLIMFDVNNISQINRDFGHAKGDEIIKVVADKIKQSLRDIDIAGRYGGDEIAVILPNMDNSEACYIAEYLNYSLSCCLIDDVGPVKVSIGIASYPSSATNQEKLLILAEQSMFISKSKGCNNKASFISAEDIDFWNEMALDSFAAVIAKRHAQWGINFEEELVKKFHDDSLNTNNNHMLDVVTSLAGAIDAKDTYTKGHSTSVSRYAEALAKALNLSDNEVERIKLGALLHDVGKIGIPESVLKKPTHLTDDEWEVMKQHPTIGVEKVLEPIESLRDLIPMVEHHHEHWDGSGYPAGLKGEEIPLEARIISIADTFHALISDRPYRKGLSVDKAVEILRVGAGMQWDRDLIRKFIIIAPSLSTSV